MLALLRQNAYLKPGYAAFRACVAIPERYRDVLYVKVRFLTTPGNCGRIGEADTGAARE